MSPAPALLLALWTAWRTPGPPPLSDLARFPNAGAVAEALRLNEGCRGCLECRRGFCPRDWDFYEAALADAWECRRPWQTLADAQCPEYDPRYRRQALQRLRDLLGGEYYQAGFLPQPVPLWAFRGCD